MGGGGVEHHITYFLILRYFKMFYHFYFIFRLFDTFSAPFKFYSSSRRLLKFKKPLTMQFLFIFRS